MKYSQTFENFVNESWFKSKDPLKIYKDQIKFQEDIIEEISHLENLDSHEGKFKSNSKTWFRNGDLIPSQPENDRLITDYAGISLSYNLKNKEYEMSLPIKFKNEFRYQILDLLKSKNYKILKTQTTPMNYFFIEFKIN